MAKHRTQVRGKNREDIEGKIARLSKILDECQDSDAEKARAISVYILLLRGHETGSALMSMFGVETEEDLSRAVKDAQEQLESKGEKAPNTGEKDGGAGKQS